MLETIYWTIAIAVMSILLVIVISDLVERIKMRIARKKSKKVFQKFMEKLGDEIIKNLEGEEK